MPTISGCVKHAIRRTVTVRHLYNIFSDLTEQTPGALRFCTLEGLIICHITSYGGILFVFIGRQLHKLPRAN